MEYHVFESKRIEDLIKDVNNAIKEGWRLQGGVSTSIDSPSLHHDHYYAQAMIRETK